MRKNGDHRVLDCTSNHHSDACTPDLIVKLDDKDVAPDHMHQRADHLRSHRNPSHLQLDQELLGQVKLREEKRDSDLRSRILACVLGHCLVLANQQEQTLAKQEDDCDWNEHSDGNHPSTVEKHTAVVERTSPVSLGGKCLLPDVRPD